MYALPVQSALRNYVFSILLSAFFLLLFAPPLIGQNPGKAGEPYRVFLLANLVDAADSPAYLEELSKWLDAQPEPFTLVLNGDFTRSNLKKAVEKEADMLRMEKLVALFRDRPDRKLYFLPGDRDWDDSGKDGLKNVLKLEALVKSFDLKNVRFLPTDGCPGPKVLDLAPQLTLVAINTQWWNHPYDRPDDEDASCSIGTDEAFIEELEDIFEESHNKNILVAGHFPVLSLGESGGRVPPKKHLLPFPIVGSLAAAYRQNVGTQYDSGNERFHHIREEMATLFMQFPSVMYASGQDPILQVLREDENYYINSGAINKGGYAAKDKQALFAAGKPGLVELAYETDGSVRYQIHILSGSGFLADKTGLLFQSACKPVLDEAPVTQAYIPCKPEPEVGGKLSGDYSGTVMFPGFDHYDVSGFVRLFYGMHYRKSWIQPVRVPYLNLDTVKGGLIPFAKGGGRQTTSLKLIAGNGSEYVFRSVDKDPVKALSYDLRKGLIAATVRDQTSTQHPYGAMAVDILLDPLDIPHASPVLYQMPDDPVLGPFQSVYGGLLGMLEERPKGKEDDRPPFFGADEVKRSVKMYQKLYRDHDYRVEDSLLLRARLFDIWVGDWSKHEDNWKWAGYRTDKGMNYKPIPRDRDHVFSRWDGILPWVANRRFLIQNASNFNKKLYDLKNLTWQARHMDRFLLAGLSREDWEKQASVLQSGISDSLIDAAMRNMPMETYAHTGTVIAEKLRVRLSDMDRYASDYYELLAKQVDVVGSHKKEYFKVFRLPDGKVSVKMYDMGAGKQPDMDQILYSRTFLPGETREIRLFGLGSDDIFEIEGEASKSIRLRVIGGKGEDEIFERSNVSGPGRKTFIYETNKDALIETGSEGRVRNPVQTELNRYNQTAFHYNTWFPVPLLSYSVDDGFGFGLSLSHTRYNFEKEDYASNHKLSARVTTAGIMNFTLSSRFHHAIRRWDLLLDLAYNRPNNLTFFFGTGNESLKDNDLFLSGYYKTRYNSASGFLGISRGFWRFSSFTIRAGYQKNQAQIGDSTFVADRPMIFGREDVDLIRTDVALDLDFRDHRNFPERGMRLFVMNKGSYILDPDTTSPYGIVHGSLEFYATTHSRKFPLTLGLKAGGAHAYGKGPVPFYDLPSLGQTTHLRGFFRNRFVGKSALYGNSELRLQLLDRPTVIVPIRFGIFGFFDTGRVFLPGEKSNSWHSGYGGGIYLMPIDRNFTFSLSAGFSEEETGLILFSLGTALK